MEDGCLSSTPGYFLYWGKTDRFGDGSYHLLPYHSLDVAAVAAVLLARHPSYCSRLARLFGLSTDDVSRWIPFLIALHDIGKFADWSDIEAMGDLEPYTVFYAPPVVEPGGYYRAAYSFEETGTYIGVVTARHPTENRDYNAVFYFQVGGFDWGTLPLFLAIALLLQAGYWWNNCKVGSA